MIELNSSSGLLYVTLNLFPIKNTQTQTQEKQTVGKEKEELVLSCKGKKSRFKLGVSSK